MNPQLKVILFIVTLIALIAFQYKVVKPLVMKVVQSDLFLTDSDDQGTAYAITDKMTDFANMHCSHYISEDLGGETQPVFSDKPINAWDIGNHTYVINSELEMTDRDGRPHFKTYVCRISYEANTDPANYDNWSVYGISGLD